MKKLLLIFVLLLNLILFGCLDTKVDGLVETKDIQIGGEFQETQTDKEIQDAQYGREVRESDFPPDSKLVCGEGFELLDGECKLVVEYKTNKVKLIGNTVTAIIKTNKGLMTFLLYDKTTPLTVNNFVSLAGSGFYDGLIFHRIIKGFMIQGGCPNGDGTGGPGYSIKDEFITSLSHDRVGVLSMANKGQPDTGGSQFFITLAPALHLDGKHTIFGEIIDGEDILKAIENVSTDSRDKPLEDVIIESITIEY